MRHDIETKTLFAVVFKEDSTKWDHGNPSRQTQTL